jgi:hypothetical protein
MEPLTGKKVLIKDRKDDKEVNVNLRLLFSSRPTSGV